MFLGDGRIKSYLVYEDRVSVAMHGYFSAAQVLGYENMLMDVQSSNSMSSWALKNKMQTLN